MGRGFSVFLRGAGPRSVRLCTCGVCENYPIVTRTLRREAPEKESEMPVLFASIVPATHDPATRGAVHIIVTRAFAMTHSGERRLCSQRMVARLHRMKIYGVIYRGTRRKVTIAAAGVLYSCSLSGRLYSPLMIKRRSHTHTAVRQ